jgi:hypothetical protein
VGGQRVAVEDVQEVRSHTRRESLSARWSAGDGATHVEQRCSARVRFVRRAATPGRRKQPRATPEPRHIFRWRSAGAVSGLAGGMQR